MKRFEIVNCSLRRRRLKDILPERSMTSPRRSRVSYLPVNLTSFQRDLVEILISLNAKAFEEELSANASNTSADQEDGKSYPQLSTKQMMYMFDNNFRCVANHPCLLVDHYMPRQFLRKQPKENLINTSDKFMRLQKLLSGFIGRDRTQFPQLLRICLISHSVRELDLLEGLILGQRVRIKRLSGTSLYNEHHIYNEKPAASRPGDYESRDATPFNETGANKYTGYSRDDYDYSLKRRKCEDDKVKDDWLFLTTTAHLINDPSLLDDYEIDYILSFDPLLDPSLPAIEKLNIKLNQKVPIIKFLVTDSPDHYILANASEEEYGNFSDLKKSIDHFLCTRHLRHDAAASVDYYQLVASLLRSEQAEGLLPSIELSTLDNSVTPYEPHLTPLKHFESHLTADKAVYDMKSYQSELANRVMKRYLDLQEESQHMLQVVAEYRLEETKRQNTLDDLKATVATKFKKLQEVEKELNESEKRLERCQTESGKLDEREKFLELDKNELERLSNLTNDNALANVIREYTERNLELQNQLDELEASNEEKGNRNEQLRTEYQQKSSQAAEQAQRLTKLKASLDLLNKDAKGPASSIQADILKDQENRLKEELNTLKSKSQFYQAYVNKMTARYDLKLIPNGESSQNSSSSLSGRSSGHGSRFRSTRSNTPTYT